MLYNCFGLFVFAYDCFINNRNLYRSTYFFLRKIAVGFIYFCGGFLAEFFIIIQKVMNFNAFLLNVSFGYCFIEQTKYRSLITIIFLHILSWTDLDFDSYWEKEARNPVRNRIRIGRQYQAQVPPLLTSRKYRFLI